jgi:hypothetical protein
VGALRGLLALDGFDDGGEVPHGESRFLRFCALLKLPELLRPRSWGCVAHAVLGHEGTLVWHTILRADVRVGVAATTSLLFGIVRIKWCVKSIGISHWSGALEFSAKGAVLKDGEEGIEFCEMGPLQSL